MLFHVFPPDFSFKKTKKLEFHPISALPQILGKTLILGSKKNTCANIPRFQWSTSLFVIPGPGDPGGQLDFVSFPGPIATGLTIQFMFLLFLMLAIT